MLYKYNVTGKNSSGKRIKETLHALDDSHALRQIYSKHGKLRDLDMSTSSELQEPIPEIKQSKKYFSSSGYSDDEIVAMMELINAHQGSLDHHAAVRAHFNPILSAAVLRYPDLTSSERDQYKEDLLNEIIQHIAPKFESNRGYLLSFVKMKIEDRIQKKYDRQKNVNANNKKKKRARSNVLAEYVETIIHAQKVDQEDARVNLIRIIQLIGDHDLSTLPRSRIEEVHERIFEFQLHEQLTRRQKEIYGLTYGPKRLKQIEISQLLNTSQPCVSTTLRRAKSNVWKNILKINVEE